jgi:hypothetical protein
MGEYIKIGGVDKKIGTCESMYYVTHENLLAISKQNRDAEPYVRVDSGCRFRFPFPDESHIKSQHDFEDYERGYMLKFPSSLPVSANHDEVFHRVGYARNKKTPSHNEYGIHSRCPQSQGGSNKAIRWGNSDFQLLEIVQQKLTTQQEDHEMLVTVARCPYCGALFQLDRDEVNAIIGHFKEGIEAWPKDKENVAFCEERLELLNIALAGYYEI